MKRPIVLVPGIQGRWEWMIPAVNALAQHYDVKTFSLNEAAAQDSPQRLHTFFERWHERIDAITAETGPAVLAGVSFGGIIALTYAAARPGRISHLVLVSTPSPRFRLDARQEAYTRKPAISLPVFAWRATGRLSPEIVAALPSWRRRCLFAASYVTRTVRSPVSPTLMAAWAREWMSADLEHVCHHITAPTLLITGEPELDRVVPVSSSLEYLQLIPGARHETLPATGHIGILLKPRTFAGIVTRFVESSTSLNGHEQTQGTN